MENLLLQNDILLLLPFLLLLRFSLFPFKERYDTPSIVKPKKGPQRSTQIQKR